MALPNSIPIPFPIDFVTIPQTNFKRGRSRAPDLIVLHITEGSKRSAIAQFSNPTTEVSSHFLIAKDGTITQFVGSADTAFANGVLVAPISSLVLERLPANPNDYSVSIEHEGLPGEDLTPAQYVMSARLVKYLGQKWNIPMDSTHVIRHREITGTKTCPGVVNIETIIRNARYT